MSWDRFFLQLPAAFSVLEATWGLPSPAAVAGGEMSGVGLQCELAEGRGKCSPSPKTAAAGGASWSPGQPWGYETPGLPLLAASPSDLDPAVSAGCLMQHQDSPQSHRDSKSWVS